MDTVVDLTDLPPKLVDRAMKLSGKRSAKTVVKAALQALIAQAETEPMTPEQCAARLRAAGPVRTSRKLRQLGLDEAFFA